MKVADEIGQVKKDQTLRYFKTPLEWNSRKMILDGEQKDFLRRFVLRMFKAIHQESIVHQEKWLTDKA
jgi:chorismate mutase